MIKGGIALVQNPNGRIRNVQCVYLSSCEPIMSLVEEYYEVNEVEEVNVIWKVLHIGLYGFAAALGLWCGFELAILRVIFDDKCHLFTNVKPSSNNSSEIDQNNINWESDTWCEYYQFSMISSFVVGIIWGTLFLMCGKGGKSGTGLPQPWRIVWPSLIFNTIYFIIILSSAIQIQLGTNHFCKYNFSTKSNSTIRWCKVLGVLLKKDIEMTAFHLKVVLRTSWACASCWLFLFFLSLLRIFAVVDFQLYKICVFKVDDKIQTKKEKILKITNYEDLKQQSEHERKRSTLEDIPPDLEAGIKKKKKADKKSMRHVNLGNRYQLKPKTITYDTADIRMLHREKTRKNSKKILDDTFLNNENFWASGLGRSIKIQSNSTVSTSLGIAINPFSKESNSNEEGEEENGGSSQTSDYNEDRNETGSDSEILGPDFDANHFLKLKKRM